MTVTREQVAEKLSDYLRRATPIMNQMIEEWQKTLPVTGSEA